MTAARFVLRMARREFRGARRQLWLLTGAVAAGVAALVAVNSFAANLRHSVTTQAQALLGADLVFSSRRPFPEAVQAMLDSLARRTRNGRTAALARVTGFGAMAFVPHGTGVRLVQVSGVEPGYPFYGIVETDPPGAWATLQAGGRVLVDASLLPSLGAEIGDTLALGEARLVIAGVITSHPGTVAAASAFSPPVYIAAQDVARTGLIGQFGARVEYEAYVRLPDPGEAQRLATQYRPVLRGHQVRVRSLESYREDLRDALTRLGNYLGLVALIALLLGGLGVASAVSVFMRRRLDTIAVLRCLGASAGQIFAVFLLQAAVMGGVGSGLGAVIGVALQQVLPALLRDLLPVDVQIRLAPTAILLGMGIGLWVAVIFSLLPLLGIRHVSPLMTLRRDVERVRQRRDPLRLVAASALGTSILGLCVLQVGSLLEGAVFAGGVGLALLSLWLASLGLIRGVRRFFPRRWPYLWRQGLANLYRPANQTVMVVLSLGFGAFLLSTLYLVQRNLLRDLRLGAPGERPNLVFFDIQGDQRDGVVQILRDAGVAYRAPVAIVPMRIRSVKGVPVRAPRRDATAPDSTRNRDNWAFRREYRSTYRDTLVASERLIAGTWWNGPATDPLAPVKVSLEVEVARELDVTIGDEIVWDVQGVEVRSRVANLREVDWARIEPNFFAVFQPGVLERAPQTLVILANAGEPAARGRVQRMVVERYPNVTSVDIGTVQAAVEQVLDRVAVAVRFMAGFSLATGVAVLIGAIATTRFQRIREGVLLKTLGATRPQVFRVVLAEYLALGGLSSVMAVSLAVAAAWVIMRSVFDASLSVPSAALAGIVGTVVSLTVLVGLWNSLDVLNRTPLEVLRNE